MPFTKEDVTKLAYRRYKSKESYADSVWYLAELCVTINKNIKNGYDIKPLETDNLVLLIRENVNGEVIKPTEEEVKEIVNKEYVAGFHEVLFNASSLASGIYIYSLKTDDFSAVKKLLLMK